jgi:microtubule-associated protein-like 6
VAAAKAFVPAGGFDFGVEESGAGDEFMAVKPWIGAIQAPTTPPAANSAEPDVDHTLDWVYGFDAQTCRDSLRYTAEGKIVYSAAAVGVVYDAAAHAAVDFYEKR